MDRIGNRSIYFAVEDKCFQLSANDGKVVCSFAQLQRRSVIDSVSGD